MQILIVTGGSIDAAFAKEFYKEHIFDRVIAADAGLAACHDLGIRPTDILGDFDSLKNLELREAYRQEGVPVREFPTRKDYTDTHLAVLYAMDLWKEALACDQLQEDSALWILGGSGSRMDHSLSNLGMLVLLAEEGIPATMVDAHNRVELLKGPASKRYAREKEWKYFSLLPFTAEVTGIDLIGFSYPLEDATLRAFESMGISNEIEDAQAFLRIKNGYLLIIRARD